MTSATTPAPLHTPGYADSFGTTITPGSEVGLVMINKTPGFTFARATVVDAEGQLAFDVHEYRDSYGAVVVQPTLSNSAPPMMAVLGSYSSAFGQDTGARDVFGSALHTGDRVVYLLWDGAELVPLGRGTVAGVQQDMVSVIAAGSAASQIRDGQQVLAPATTLFRLAV